MGGAILCGLGVILLDSIEQLSEATYTTSTKYSGGPLPSRGEIPQRQQGYNTQRATSSSTSTLFKGNFIGDPEPAPLSNTTIFPMAQEHERQLKYQPNEGVNIGGIVWTPRDQAVGVGTVIIDPWDTPYIEKIKTHPVSVTAGINVIFSRRSGGTNLNYKEVFFREHPELRGEVVVHHEIEQQVLRRPETNGLFSEAEIHSYENLRGIPKTVNSEIHLSKIRKEWNEFYKQNPVPTKHQLIEKRLEIDKKYGDNFNPQKKD